MNPLLNAYNYQIKKLTEEINFLRNQNISLLSYLNEGFDYPEGYEIAQGPSGTQLPPGFKPLLPGQENNPFTFPGGELFNRPGLRGRGRFLQRVWKKFTTSGHNDPEVLLGDYLRYNFNRIFDILGNMTESQWRQVLEYMRSRGIDVDAMTLQQLMQFFDSPAIRAIYNPGAMRRFGKWLKKGVTWLYNNKYVRWSAILLAIIAASWRAFGFSSEEEFNEALQRWIDSGSQEPPDWATEWGNQNGSWDSLPPPDPDFDLGVPVLNDTDSIPSMLPPNSTLPTAPELPGGGGGGFGGPRPIDPTQMGM
jgi:hypothetical protein